LFCYQFQNFVFPSQAPSRSEDLTSVMHDGFLRDPFKHIIISHSGLRNCQLHYTAPPKCESVGAYSYIRAATYCQYAQVMTHWYQHDRVVVSQFRFKRMDYIHFACNFAWKLITSSLQIRVLNGQNVTFHLKFHRER
jgi:hypothetical protein